MLTHPFVMRTRAERILIKGMNALPGLSAKPLVGLSQPAVRKWIEGWYPGRVPPAVEKDPEGQAGNNFREVALGAPHSIEALWLIRHRRVMM